MITPLSISEINKKADYSVERDEITGSYDFTTDYGVQISIDFDDDFMITSSVSYQLIIGNANNKKSPRDHKLQTTVIAILEEFFEKKSGCVAIYMRDWRWKTGYTKQIVQLLV